MQTSKLRATSKPALCAEPLEPRQMLAATVLNFGAALPEFRNDALNTVDIEFSEAVTGFDKGDLIFTLDGVPVSLDSAQLTTADDESFSLTNLASLTGDEGEYQLTLDVLASEIVDIGSGGLPLDSTGFGLGPELIVNGSFDTSRDGGSNDLTGWSVPVNIGGVVWEGNPGDGVARVISDTSHPDGAAGARIRQFVTLQADTEYQLEFDFITTDVGGGTSVWLRVIDHRGSGPGQLLRANLDEGDNGHFTDEFLTLEDTEIHFGFFAPTLPFPQIRDFTIDNVSVRQIVLGPSVQWTVDTTAPTATISEVVPSEVVPSPRNSAVSGVTISFDEPVSGLELGDLTLTRDGEPDNLLPPGATLTPASGNRWMLGGLDSATGQDGNHVLTLGTGVQDLATNFLAGSVIENWTMDTVAPTISVNSKFEELTRSPELTGSVGDSSATVEVMVDGQSHTANVNGTTWTLPAGTIDPPLADGTYNVVVTATDLAGNSRSDSTTNDLTLDAGPVVTVDKIRTADTTPRVTGTIDDPNATIDEVTINGVIYSNNEVIISGNTWELPDDTITVPLAEGTYDVTVKATDASIPSHTATITVVNTLDIDLKPIVINEILFRPSSPRAEPTTAGNAEPTDEEYVELYNNSELPFDVGGWKFTSGFRYTIPQGTIIPAREYLVVASDVDAFTAEYGAVPLLVGGDGSGNELTDWIGTLSNSGENIRFRRDDGALVDRVRYADSGDWAVRQLLRHPVGNQLGWEWVAPHDDLGHSLELMNPDLTNREGQNWAPSAAPRGTPGAANSAATGDIAPMLLDVKHSPAIPQSNEPVVVSARIVNEADSGVEVSLLYRIDPASPPFNSHTSPTSFVELAMVDDGGINDEGGDSGSGDAIAGDGVFSATVPGQSNRTIVDFYVQASENNGANVRFYPAPTDTDPAGLAGPHDANLQFQFDDSVADDFLDPWPGNQPIYRLVQTRGEDIGLRNHRSRVDHLENGTFIVHDPSRGIDVDNGDLASFNLDDETVSILLRENLFVGGENIDAAHVRDNGHIILSTKSGATLGGLSFRDGDLVEYDPTEDTATLIFSEDAFGRNEDIDAIWVKESGGRITELIFSTNDNFRIDLGDGNFIDILNGDLVKIVVPEETNLNETPLSSLVGLSVTRVFSEALFVGGADIDGVHKDGNDFLISTTGSEQFVDGLAFTNGSVVRFDPMSSTATIFFDESNFGDGNEDIDALALFVDLDGFDQLVLSTDGDNARLGSEFEIFYNIGVRNRGNGSRGIPQQQLRVAFPRDHLFRGESSIPLNTQNSHNQLLGMTIFHEAGLSAETPIKAVQVRRQGINDASGGGNYGAYVQLQARDGNLPEAHYPLDSGGNLYALNDRAGGNSATFTQPPNFDYKDRIGHDTGYAKQSNGSADDWRDLSELARAFSTSLTPNSAGGDDLNFVHKVSQVINVSEWLRHMAVTGLIRNNEGGYANAGRGDDYGLYRGEFDTRFELVPHDVDTTFTGTNDPVIRDTGPNFSGLFRVLNQPAFRAIFSGHLIDLMDNVFNPEHIDPIIDELFGEGTVEGTNDWVPTNIITNFKNFIVGRNNFVRGRIASNGERLGNPVSPYDLSQLPAEYQSLADQQRYLRISEIMFNPRGEELEFVELINTGNAPLDLTGVHFKGGILFGFNFGAPIDSPIPQTPETILGPGERVLIVKDREAFLLHHDPDGSKGLDAQIAGEFWNGRLSNTGERILLEGRLGEPILDFSFSDNWYDQTDGEGFSLVLREDIDANTPRSAWGEKGTWRASGFTGGSPGEANLGFDPDSIRINEILSHTDLAANGDWIELHNTTDAAINISGWYLSDSGNNLRKFRIPDGTEIPGRGFQVFDQFGPGGFGVDPATHPAAFGLSELGDTLRLSSVDPDDIRENIDAAHVLANGNIVLSTTGTAMLGTGAFSFRNGDLIEYNPDTGVVELLFSELTFIGEAENIDAVSVLDNNNIVLSTGGPAMLPAAGGTTLSFGNGDLIEWDPQSKTATLVFSEALFDAELGGLVPNENIDAVHALGGGVFIISTSGPASIDDQLFDDGDLIEIIPGAGSNFAEGVLGAASVSRYFSEALFAIEPLGTVPTENIDAVFIGADDHVVLSAASSFSLISPFSTPQLAFDDGDLVKITLGVDANLGGESPSFGDGAQATRLLPESTFYGRAAGYRETANFGAAEKEVTFGIHEKSPSSTDTTDFVAQENTTRNGENSVPIIGPIVINEIMYHPPGDATPADVTDDVEFIELFNITGSDVDLWDPANPTNTWTISSAFNFAFPQNTTIPAGGYLLLVSGDPVTFRTDNPNVPAGVDVLRYSGRLDNAGEAIRLNKPGEPEPITGFVPAILVDRVKYDDEFPWPIGVNGADGTGRSLSRFISEDYGNDVANWLPSGPPESLGGSPGQANTTFDISPPTAPTNLTSVAVTNSRIDVSWTAAFEPHSGISVYEVFRDGQSLGITSTTSFSDNTVVGTTTYTYRVNATNLDDIVGPLSDPISVAILRLSSTEVPTVRQVRVELSEAVGAATVGDVGHYQITGPTVVTVQSASLDVDGRTVILTTSPMEEQTTYTLRVSGVVAESGNTLAQSPQTIAVHVPDLTAPRITDVQLASTDWSDDFIAQLDAAGLGIGGFSIPGGSDQLGTIGWSNVNQIIIHFDEHVIVQSGDLSVFGVNHFSYEFSDFAYDQEALTATWTLQGSLPAEKLLLELSDDVHDDEILPIEGNNPIDGNWQDGADAFPSGNGIIESDDRFTFSLNVLPGDTDGGSVARSDLLSTMFHLGRHTGNSNYEARFDSDGSGRVDVDDLRHVVRRLSTSLPTGTPGGGGQAPVVALDTLFERLGAGGSPQEALADAPLMLTASTPASPIPRAATSPALARRAGRVAARRAAIQAVDVALADGDDDGSLLSLRDAIRRGRRTSRRR